MLEPKIQIGQVATLKLQLVKCVDGAVLIGVGNKSINLEYYLGQSETGVSCYFKQRGGDDAMKVIFGSTSSGYGKCANEGDIIEATFDTIQGTISFKIY